MEKAIRSITLNFVQTVVVLSYSSKAIFRTHLSNLIGTDVLFVNMVQSDEETVHHLRDNVLHYVAVTLVDYIFKVEEINFIDVVVLGNVGVAVNIDRRLEITGKKVGTEEGLEVVLIRVRRSNEEGL